MFMNTKEKHKMCTAIPRWYIICNKVFMCFIIVGLLQQTPNNLLHTPLLVWSNYCPISFALYCMEPNYWTGSHYPVCISPTCPNSTGSIQINVLIALNHQWDTTQDLSCLPLPSHQKFMPCCAVIPSMVDLPGNSPNRFVRCSKGQ